MGYIQEDFRLYYPSLYEETEEFIERSPFELIAKLKDGRAISFYILDNSIVRLPRDCLNMTEKDYKRIFGLNLERLIYRKGLTQIELSEITGISQAMISNYVTGKCTPSSYNLEKLANALHCSLDEFRYNY